MLSEKLLSELLKLSRAEKLQAMQILVNDLNAEEIASAPLYEMAGSQEDWAPYGRLNAAGILPGTYSDYREE